MAQIRFSLGAKLALIIGLIVVVSLGTVTFLNGYFISEDMRITAEENNLLVNTRAANLVQNELSQVCANTMQLLDVMSLVRGGQQSAASKQMASLFFERNQSIAAILVLDVPEPTAASKKTVKKVLALENTLFFTQHTIKDTYTDDFLRNQVSTIARVCAGETLSINASPFYNTFLLALFIPYRENATEQCCLILFDGAKISEQFRTGATTFAINSAGELLLHPHFELVLHAEKMQDNPLVMAVQSSRGSSARSSHQMQFSVENAAGKVESYIGAYQTLSVADVSVLTTVPLSVVLEGARATVRNNIYLMLVVLFISVALILLFARFCISRHLRMLTACAEEIQNGNFNSELIPLLNVRRRDEIGILNQSTKDEQEFLNTFAHFTNKGVAKAIARKEIDFDPHLKDVTIFFSDIRGFTAISDTFKTRFQDDSPREIIGFLNDYMSRMVNCVTISGGTIDKFEGDAIMAVWGILRDESLAFEQLPDGDSEKERLAALHHKHVQEDAIAAIRGTVAMRYALMQYNKDAKAFTASHVHEARAQYKPHIQIGCGINTGRATCGIMGSEDKMEYTAIGDSVNFASRTESANKPCGTDILITEDTYNLLKKDYIRCYENDFSLSPEHEADELVVEQIPVAFDVKGKGEQHFYGVVNMPQFDIAAFFSVTEPDFTVDADCAQCVGPQGPKTLADVRTLLGIPIPDFETVHLNEEENKIQIKK